MKLKLTIPIFIGVLGVTAHLNAFAAPKAERKIVVAPFCYSENTIYLAQGTGKATKRFQWSDSNFEKATQYLEEMIKALPELNASKEVCKDTDKLMASVGFLKVAGEVKRWESEIPSKFKPQPSQITPDKQHIVFMFTGDDPSTFEKMSYLYAFLREDRTEDLAEIQKR